MACPFPFAQLILISTPTLYLLCNPRLNVLHSPYHLYSRIGICAYLRSDTLHSSI